MTLSAQPLRIGLIGLDTSHAPYFCRSFNDSSFVEHVPGGRVVCAYKGGSPDISASYTRIEGFTQEVREKWGVEIVADIATLLQKVDAVILTSVDGRVHLQQVQPVLAAHKPVFIDKPMAAGLKEVQEIFRLADHYQTPCFSASSLRFLEEFYKAMQEHTPGAVLGCEAYSPATIEPHHPDLVWYGIHGVEMLFAAMGPACDSVQRVFNQDTDVVTGKWADGRLATFRGLRSGHKGYGIIVFGEKSISHYCVTDGAPYQSMLQKVIEFFQTGKSPVPRAETLAMFAFMEAADISKNQNGAWVPIELNDR